MSETRHWMFWDGDCGFCQWSKDWLMRRNRSEQFRPVPYQLAPRPPMTDDLAAKCNHTVFVLAADGTLYRGSRAFLFFTSLTGWGWFARLMMLPPFVWVFDLGYWIVAKNRMRISRWMGIQECRLEDRPDEGS